jgi:crossover junction endodeoxyribonuclease RuvC
MSKCATTVLGIDPGIGTTGWAVVGEAGGKFSLIASGCIRPRRTGPVGERLHEIFNGVASLCGEFSPGEAALEESFYGKNVKSALVIGQARAAVLLAAVETGVPIFEYPARLVKQAVTGQGQAAKGQVGFMVRNLLGLREPLVPEDASDAAALALCHLMRRTTAAALR